MVCTGLIGLRRDAAARLGLHQTIREVLYLEGLASSRGPARRRDNASVLETRAGKYMFR